MSESEPAGIVNDTNSLTRTWQVQFSMPDHNYDDERCQRRVCARPVVNKCSALFTRRDATCHNAQHKRARYFLPSHTLVYLGLRLRLRLSLRPLEGSESRGRKDEA
eukprot:1082157-Rhodomonas_salina.2